MKLKQFEHNFASDQDKKLGKIIAHNPTLLYSFSYAHKYHPNLFDMHLNYSFVYPDKFFL